MSIQNRLKNLESETKTEGKFCACPETRKHEFIHRRGGKDTVTVPVADVCDKCGKPIEKHSIIFRHNKRRINEHSNQIKKVRG
jgi:hypothetical protein